MKKDYPKYKRLINKQILRRPRFGSKKHMDYDELEWEFEEPNDDKYDFEA